MASELEVKEMRILKKPGGAKVREDASRLLIGRVVLRTSTSTGFLSRRCHGDVGRS
jgi:hypothetical protein